MLSCMFFVNCVRISTSRGNTAEWAGTNNTSSNVSPSPKNLEEADLLGELELFLVAMCKDSLQANYPPNEIFGHCNVIVKGLDPFIQFTGQGSNESLNLQFKQNS